MGSYLIPTAPPATTTTTQSRDSHVHSHNKKKKPHSKNNQKQHHHHQHNNRHVINKWKSQTQQNLYSTKLRQALAGSTLSAGGKSVRETADRVLATAARGRSRWSRAILTNRLKLSFMKKKKTATTKKRVAAAGAGSRRRRSRLNVVGLNVRTVPAVQKKVRLLGRLVPGCRKEPLPVILEEAIDYIPALEMQVRAMTALANLLLANSSSSSSSSTAHAPPT